MQVIFKYDLDRLQSYAIYPDNRIKIANQTSYMMFAFPEVGYFNYSFQLGNKPFEQSDLENIKEFYFDQQIQKHKLLVSTACISSNALIKKDHSYKLEAVIAKTTLPPDYIQKPIPVTDLKFIKVKHTNIDQYTNVYLNAFEAENRDPECVSANFKTLLQINGLDLYLLQHEGIDVGINVLYRNGIDSFLAGGAILPESRGKGYHQSGIGYRIEQSLADESIKNTVSWAYHPGISLQNMLKLNMQIQEEFNVYEYCK